MASKAVKEFKVGDKVYCTKYGVLEGCLYRYTVVSVTDGYVSLGTSNGSLFVSAKNCHTDKAEALKVLQGANAKKIKSLQKQIENLQNVTYVEKQIS
jgi:metal-responsive CopG/Arc/MetJ family transcriptional regulator